MNLDELENALLGLCAAGEFDLAEAKKRAATPWIKATLASDFSLGTRALVLYSKLAGEAEAFDNFLALLEALAAEGLITRELADDLTKNSPANRWLD